MLAACWVAPLHAHRCTRSNCCVNSHHRQSIARAAPSQLPKALMKRRGFVLMQLFFIVRHSKVERFMKSWCISAPQAPVCFAASHEAGDLHHPPQPLLLFAVLRSMLLCSQPLAGKASWCTGMKTRDSPSCVHHLYPALTSSRMYTRLQSVALSGQEQGMAFASSHIPFVGHLYHLLLAWPSLSVQY